MNTLHGEVNRHRGLVAGKRLKLLALRHRRAPFEAGNNQALGDFRDGVFDAQLRRGAQKRADARHHLPVDAAFSQLFALLAYRAVQRHVSGL